MMGAGVYLARVNLTRHVPEDILQPQFFAPASTTSGSIPVRATRSAAFETDDGAAEEQARYGHVGAIVG